MEVLALNCSPRMDQRNTALILTPFIEGLRENGADVELCHAYRLKINPCQGDMSCWLRTPGECYQDDDMRVLYPKLREADVLVFAAPVFVDGMPWTMKTLIDRMVALLRPHIEIRDGHCRHLVRKGHKHSKVALVSSCGFWEMDNFAPLVMHLQAICKNACWKYAGALLRPHSGALWYMLRKGMPVHDVVGAAKEAGRELAIDSKMSDQTLKTVGRELCSLETYVEKLDHDFKKALNRLKECDEL